MGAILLFFLLIRVYLSSSEIYDSLRESRIGINDAEDRIKNFPYQVSLRFNNTHICGGSILDKRTILTAQRCLEDVQIELLSVTVGCSIHNEGTEYKIATIFKHPNYGKTSLFDSDVAVLKLEKPLIFNTYVQPIDLQPPGVEVPAKTFALVTGWKLTREVGEKEYPDIIQKAFKSIIDHEDCKDFYDNYIRLEKSKTWEEPTVTENMICAQMPGSDACQGDYGGPLVAIGKQVGIVSWGIGCGRNGNPGVYTKVSVFHDWIVKYMDP